MKFFALLIATVFAVLGAGYLYVEHQNTSIGQFIAMTAAETNAENYRFARHLATDRSWCDGKVPKSITVGQLSVTCGQAARGFSS